MGRYYMKSKNKALTCLWLVMVLLLSSEIGSDGCETNWSKDWSEQGLFCVGRGACNVACRIEGFDSGECKKLVKCLCRKNCRDGE